MSTQLHLVRCTLDARKLFAFAKRSRAAGFRFDEGYAVHAAFAALFDNGAGDDARVAPKPFHITSFKGGARRFDVLGYTKVDHRALRERADTFADPNVWGVCDLEALASKPMPASFATGTRLGFFVRACPVRRIAKQGPMTRDRAEVDAFLARVWEVNDPEVALDREQVYREWLVEELAKEGAAKVLDASMTSFQLGHLRRRTQGKERKAREPQRPDVGFEGVLEVGDPEAFARRLERGVGRHRAFGFGMLLLRPAPGR